MPNLIKLIAFFSAVITLFSTSALAADAIKSGKVTGIDAVANGQNFGFRVYMDGTSMCGTSETWAYINKDTNNYDAIVSIITSAYLTGKTIVLTTTKEGIYCSIYYVQLR